MLDLGETNSNLEMIRLNKKFDIFLKRFMKVEEDIREIRNNFFRVMHCAFAKYEEGFKRKNEYLERRRIKKREEIERGVAKELEKRKIDALASQAANKDAQESSSDIDEFEGEMDERRFMKTMARQDEDDREQYDIQQKEEAEVKRRKNILAKKR